MKEKELEIYKEEVFESIKHIDENGIEFWYARELQKALDYSEWRKFEGVINKAITSCKQSDYKVKDHFVGADKIVKTGISSKIIKDYQLSRYACYLIVQNADSRKKIVALGQTYFAVQTRKQEIFEEEYNDMTELQKRIHNRNITKKENYQLNQTAKKAGVKNFGEFHNAGYKGLYNGETADDIYKRKGLRYREDILDNMGSDELAANIFRISLTKQKIENEKIIGEENAKIAHYSVGKKVRDTIEELGGTMPEDLPTPKKSLKEIESKETKKL